MSSKASYRYREDTRGWGNNPRNASRQQSLYEALMRQPVPVAKPLAWDDVENFKGKNVWGVFDGVRQQMYVISLAPEGKEGERWYVMPSNSARCLTFSISKSKLELAPKPCTALAIRPVMAIVVYQGGV